MAERVLSAAKKDQMALFVHKSAKVKAVRSPTMALMLMLYPTVLGFGLASRLGMFSLMIPTAVLPGNTTAPAPPEDRLHGAHDRWETDAFPSLVRTITIFAAVTVVHMAFVFSLTSVGIKGSYRLTACAASVAPGVLWVCTTCYMAVFISIARYNAHDGEWMAGGIVSLIILFFTIFLLAKPVDFDKTVEEENDPEVPE